jgi:predicted O-methyltransferase YrrM
VTSEAIPSLLRSVDIDITPFAEERAAAELESQVRSSIGSLESHAPFDIAHNADLALARLAYALARVIRPAIIVETGVGYGVSTAFLLQALRMNGAGALHSVDLPPLANDADEFVGYLVPVGLRDRWILHRGSARRVLPGVLRAAGAVDLFLHDSLHTRRHMLWEFNTVRPFLGRSAVLLSDDVGRNTAFSDWVRSAAPRLSLTLYEPDKATLAGVAVL